MPKRSFFVKDSELDDYQVKVINRRSDNSFIPNYALGNTKGVEALSILENKPSYQWRFLP